jgi:hypothetical protein
LKVKTPGHRIEAANIPFVRGVSNAQRELIAH